MEAFWYKNKVLPLGCDKGYEPKSAFPTVPGNPWYSEKAQAECRLQAFRPADLPTSPDGGGSMMEPLQSSAGGEGQLFQTAMGPTGKGRGCSSASESVLQRPTVRGHSNLRTEGAMPAGETVKKSMGSVSQAAGNQNGGQDTEGLQRALEGELVDFF